MLRTPQHSIYAVPSPQPLVTGPAAARVLTLSQEDIRLALARPGSYRLAIRYSAYWQGNGVDAGGVIASLEGQGHRQCSS